MCLATARLAPQHRDARSRTALLPSALLRDAHPAIDGNSPPDWCRPRVISGVLHGSRSVWQAARPTSGARARHAAAADKTTVHCRSESGRPVRVMR
jgi:hypothetical protein